MNSGLLVIVAVLLAMLVELAFGDHEHWSVVNERWILEGTGKAERIHAVERCTGLTAFLPYFARVEGVPCVSVPSDTCLKEAPDHTGWYIPIPHHVILLPEGNGGTLEHEAIHHLLWVNGRDPDWNHDGPEWACD